MEPKKTPFYDKIEIWVITILFTAMVAISGFTVFSRYLFSYTASWAEQITRIMFVWLTFAGISWAGLHGLHMRVAVLANLLKSKNGRRLMLVGDSITVLFSIYMSYKIYGVMSVVHRREQVFSAIPSMPVWIMYLGGVLGMAGLALRLIQRHIRAYCTRDAEAAKDMDAEEIPSC